MCTTRKVKGKRDIQNLDCSINYDAKGASNRRGERRISSCFVLRTLGFFLGLCCFVGFGFEGLSVFAAWVFRSYWSLLCVLLVYSGAPFAFSKLLFIKKNYPLHYHCHHLHNHQHHPHLLTTTFAFTLPSSLLLQLLSPSPTPPVPLPLLLPSCHRSAPATTVVTIVILSSLLPAANTVVLPSPPLHLYHNHSFFHAIACVFVVIIVVGVAAITLINTISPYNTIIRSLPP